MKVFQSQLIGVPPPRGNNMNHVKHSKLYAWLYDHLSSATLRPVLIIANSDKLMRIEDCSLASFFKFFNVVKSVGERRI